MHVSNRSDFCFEINVEIWFMPEMPIRIHLQHINLKLVKMPIYSGIVCYTLATQRHLRIGRQHPLLLPTNWYFRNVTFNSGYYLLDIEVPCSSWFFSGFTLKLSKLILLWTCFHWTFFALPFPWFVETPDFIHSPFSLLTPIHSLNFYWSNLYVVIPGFNSLNTRQS